MVEHPILGLSSGFELRVMTSSCTQHGAYKKEGRKERRNGGKEGRRRGKKEGRKKGKQVESSNILNRLYTVTKWNLSQEFRVDSTLKKISIMYHY